MDNVALIRLEGSAGGSCSTRMRVLSYPIPCGRWKLLNKNTSQGCFTWTAAALRVKQLEDGDYCFSMVNGGGDSVTSAHSQVASALAAAPPLLSVHALDLSVHSLGVSSKRGARPTLGVLVCLHSQQAL